MAGAILRDKGPASNGPAIVYYLLSPPLGEEELFVFMSAGFPDPVLQRTMHFEPRKLFD